MVGVLWQSGLVLTLSKRVYAVRINPDSHGVLSLQRHPSQEENISFQRCDECGFGLVSKTLIWSPDLAKLNLNIDLLLIHEPHQNQEACYPSECP